MCVPLGNDPTKKAPFTTPNPPGGKPLEQPKKAGLPPPPDKVNTNVIAPTHNRQDLINRGKAQEKPAPTDWSKVKPSANNPDRIKLEQQKSGLVYGPRGKNKVLLKLNPDGTAAYNMGQSYYEDDKNWWSAADLETPDSKPESGGISI